MKAVITQDGDGVGKLELRLVSEGANDRTLMRMLERQYPMILRDRTTNETLVVPIANVGILDLPVLESLKISSSGYGFLHGQIFRMTSDPWSGMPILGASLHVSNPDDWTIERLEINGRSVPHAGPSDRPFDLHPGAIVEVTAKHRHGGDGAFEAEVRGDGIRNDDVDHESNYRILEHEDNYRMLVKFVGRELARPEDRGRQCVFIELSEFIGTERFSIHEWDRLVTPQAFEGTGRDEEMAGEILSIATRFAATRLHSGSHRFDVRTRQHLGDQQRMTFRVHVKGG